MDNNICRFVPRVAASTDINIIHFVYETKPQSGKPLIETVYKLHLVVKGTGILRLGEKSYPLRVGDMFFLFPSVSYAIESGEDFEYLYISYIGMRANALMSGLGIRRSHSLFHDMEELIPFWQTAILDNRALLHLRCEGLLLYSLSVLGEREWKKNAVTEPAVSLIQKYIDEHYADPTLSVERLSAQFSYSSKYISTTFKKQFHIGIKEYITTLRMQKAYALMEQNITCIKDIAFQCGFSEPFYFSRVFKKSTGLTPSAYMRALREKGALPPFKA